MNQFTYFVLFTIVIFACRKGDEKIPLVPDTEFNNVYGGTASDRVYAATQSLHGTCVLAGSTENISGDRGKSDAWVLQLDRQGNIIWQKTLGASGNESAYSIAATSDGGYIFTGFTSSNDGDVSGNHGGEDAWVVKLDKNGNKEWQKTLGGSGGDIGHVILQRTNGSYMMVGNTGSNDGDISKQHGAGDAWIITVKDQ